MKKTILNLPIMLIAMLALTFTSCKKESTGNDLQSAQDENTVSSAVNATADDAANASAQVGSLSGKTNGGIILNALCGGVTVTDTSIAKQITLSYLGTGTCQGVLRSGNVTVTLTTGTSWSNEGSVITVTITNMSVTDVVTLATYTLNGTITITNESGGLAYNVFVNGAAGPVKHRHQGALQITFSDGSQRTWTFDRTRIYTGIANNLVNIELMTEGSGNIDATGTNRFGETFNNSITSPIQADNNPGCLWKPWTGTYQHQVANRTAVILFGTDLSGAQVGVEGTCVAGEGYYVTYTLNNKSYTKFVEYWN